MHAVSAPGSALRWTGWLGVASTIGLIGYLILRIAWLPSSGLMPGRALSRENEPPKKKSQSEPARPLPSGIVQADRIYGLCWFAVVSPCWAILILASAKQMLRLGHYESARLGCWLALVPLNPAWIVGVPVGIWGLRVLRRPEVREAFAARTASLAMPGRATDISKTAKP